jgi:UDP-N-acetylmuramate--alanine ligase
VAEGDESDRTLELLHPRVAAVTNVELDHHATFASEDELRGLFDEWLAGVPEVVRGEELEPVEFELGVPGEHNRRNAAVALAALELAGVDRAEAERVLPEFRGVGRRFEPRGVAGGVRVYDDYGHNPTKVAAALEAARAVAEGGRVLVLFQPHLYSRTRHSAAELAASLSAADFVAVSDVYAAREEALPGVDGKLVVDALATRRPGMAVAWTPRLEDGARFISRRARPGDLVLALGAGDVDRAAPLILEGLA